MLYRTRVFGEYEMYFEDRAELGAGRRVAYRKAIARAVGAPLHYVQIWKVSGWPK